jgi:hypothetical protein
MKLTAENTRTLYANNEGGTVVLCVNHVTGSRRWEVYERGKTSSRPASLKERQQFEESIKLTLVGRIMTREEFAKTFTEPNHSMTHRASYHTQRGELLWAWLPSEAAAVEWLKQRGITEIQK